MRWNRWIAILTTAAIVALPAQQALADDGASSASGLCAVLSHASAQAIAALEANPSLAALLQKCGNGSGSDGGSSALASTGSGQGGSQKFSDLSGYGWAAGAIDQLAQMQVLRGIGGGRFNPGGTLTRAQFAALVTRVFNLQPPAGGGPTFVDVPSSSWAASAIAAAAPYMTEYKTPGGTAFEPDLPATRIDVAATIGQLEVVDGAAQLPAASAVATIWAAFSDGSSVPSGIAQVAAVAVQLGIMKGYPNGSFGVEDPVSRAEAAVLLQRVLAAGETIGSGGSTSQSTAPTVGSVTPPTGPAAGGTLIAIVGTGFVTGATVAVGGAAATSVNVVSPNLITAMTPAGTGTVAVTVTTSAGPSTATGADQFTYTCATVQTVSGTVYCGS